jgi:RES domain-containing protein
VHSSLVAELAIAYPPPAGLWRVGRGDAPLLPSRPTAGEFTATGGNRFDAVNGDFGVLYFASTLDGCFGETLARFRPAPDLRALLKEEWRENAGFMEVGAVAADWRHRRTAVRVAVADVPPLPFLNLDSVETLQVLRERLAGNLAVLGVSDLDVAAVRGGDRRVTRLIAAWAHQATDVATGEPCFSGIRYASRLSSEWVCWAVFDRVRLEPLEYLTITPEMESLQRVAKTFDLRVH